MIGYAAAMRSRMVPCLLLALAVAGGACNDDTAPPSRDLGLDGSAAACVEPLADLCARVDGGTCPTYDAALAALRVRATMRPCYLIRVGTCGSAYRFTEESLGGLGLERRYYSASDGALVAVETESDATSFCGGTSFSIAYGPVPTCTLVQTELLCRCLPGARDAGSC